MTLRLADIGARIEGVEQLGAVINAMRGIAAARAQQARSQVEAVDAYAATLAAGIGRALTLMPSTPRTEPEVGRPALVVFAAEQGFAGAFSEHVFAELGEEFADSVLFLVGTRAATVLAERKIHPAWRTAMPSHSAGIPRLADQISEALYAGVARGEFVRLDVVFSQWDQGHLAQVRRVALLPLDLTHFASPAQAIPPLHNIAPADLLAGLTADYLHAATVPRRAARLRGRKRGANGGDGGSARPGRSPARRSQREEADGAAAGNHRGSDRAGRRRICRQLGPVSR